MRKGRIDILKKIWRIEDAMDLVKKHITISDKSVLTPLTELVGSIIGEDVYAPCPVPHFRRSTMDGYAVVAADTHGASESLPAMLHLSDSKLPMCERVYTGDLVREAFDAVMMLEYAEELLDGTVLLSRPIAAGDNIMGVGEDIAANSLALGQGRQATSHDVGVLAALGKTGVKTRDFRVGIISTGNEIVPYECLPQVGQMRDINSPLLMSLFQTAGFRVQYYGIFRDDEVSLTKALAMALEQTDAVVLSGGSSAGALDFTERAVNNLGLPGVLVHGLAVKPGKPTILGAVRGRLVVGLPGHPLSCAVMAHMVALPLLRFAAGAKASMPMYASVVLARPLASLPGRRDFIPCRLSGQEAWPQQSKSAAIQVLAASQGLLVVPEECEGYSAGTTVNVRLWGGSV